MAVVNKKAKGCSHFYKLLCANDKTDGFSALIFIAKRHINYIHGKKSTFIIIVVARGEPLIAWVRFILVLQSGGHFGDLQSELRFSHHLWRVEENRMGARPTPPDQTKRCAVGMKLGDISGRSIHSPTTKS